MSILTQISQPLTFQRGAAHCGGILDRKLAGFLKTINADSSLAFLERCLLQLNVQHTRGLACSLVVEFENHWLVIIERSPGLLRVAGYAETTFPL